MRTFLLRETTTGKVGARVASQSPHRLGAFIEEEMRSSPDSRWRVAFSFHASVGSGERLSPRLPNFEAQNPGRDSDLGKRGAWVKAISSDIIFTPLATEELNGPSSKVIRI